MSKKAISFLGYLFSGVLSVSGIPIGILGSIIGTFQDWKWVIKTDIRQWKRYPKLSNIKWWDANNNVSDYRKSYEKDTITRKAKEGAICEPGPIQKILIWSIWYGFFLPGRCISAIVLGPIEAFNRALFFWKTKVEGVSPEDLIKKEIQLILEGGYS